MKRNKLYTVNKWNRPAFMLEDKNLFWGGGDAGNVAAYKAAYTGGDYGQGGFNTNTLGNSSENVDSSGEGGGSNVSAGQIVSAAAGLGEGITAGKDLKYSAAAGNGFGLVDSTLTGGKKSKLGMTLVNTGASMMNSLGGTGWGALAAGIVGTLGTIINNGWGIKADEKREKMALENMNTLNRYKSVDTLDDITMAAPAVNVSNMYEGGVFSGGDADRMNEDIAREMSNAMSFAERSRKNNARNITDDMINNYLKNYSAYGGALDIMQNDKYIDAINNRTKAIAGKNSPSIGAFTGGARTFDDGGQLKAAFLDDFSTDPIGAAIRYNRGREQMQAQREAAAVEAQREADYMALQQRLANLETQNQGLQAIMAAQPTAAIPEIPVMPTIPEEVEAEPSPAPSKAVRTRRSGNRNWDYIEQQLRNSGKFNDIQIEGIKYNLQRESALDPTAVGDGGAAFGLAQWHGSRKPKDMSLAGQTRHLIDTLASFDGNNHWIGRGNYEGFMNARTPEEAHYYIARGYERPAQRIVNKVKRDSDMSLKRLRAFGGELGTNGTDFTNGLLYIDEGGSHESNPLEGVPLGLDAEGIPNLVEEGETVYNNYVFSDRMLVPDFMYKELGLGGTIKKKGKGMSFADASKKLAQESEQRPNDPISQAGLEAGLSKLAEVQETERARKQMEEYVGLAACGGHLRNKYDLGGAISWLRQKYPDMDEKSVKAVASALDKYIAGNESSFRKTTGLSGGISNEIDYGLAFDRLKGGGESNFNTWVENGLDKRAAFQLTHPMPKKPKNADLMTDYNKKLKEREAAWARLVNGKEAPQESQEAVSQVQQEATPVKTPGNKTRYKALSGKIYDTREEAVRDNYNASQARKAASEKAEKARENTVKASDTGNTGQQSAQPQAVSPVSRGTTPRSTASTRAFRSSDNPYGLTQNFWDGTAFDTNEDEVRAALGFGQPQPAITEEQRQAIAMDGYQPEVRPQEAAAINRMTTGLEGYNRNSYKPYQTWMRYAPAFGAGLMSLTDMLGITNSPDYTYADKLEAAANAAGYAPEIHAQPIGDYMTYNPMDIWYEQNRLDSIARAADRTIMNSSLPAANKYAALLAANYNNQLSSGNLFRNALEYNDAKKQAVTDFNRKTNMFNSQMGLEADMANARYRQQAQSLGLSGLGQAAALRDSIDARVGAARSANITNFLNSLGDIGRENFAMNQINDDDAYDYGVTANGLTPFKKRRKCGGKMKK